MASNTYSALFYDILLQTFFPEKKTKETFVALANLSATENVLDFGCGTGTLMLMIKERMPSITISGIDVNKNMVSLAAEKAKKARLNIPFSTYNGRAIPFGYNSFDKILSSYVFHHLSYRDKLLLLKELLRILKPGGAFYLMDFGQPRSLYANISFWVLRLLDGFHKTKANAKGLLVPLMCEAGWTQVEEIQVMPTPFGSVYIWKATK